MRVVPAHDKHCVNSRCNGVFLHCLVWLMVPLFNQLTHAELRGLPWLLHITPCHVRMIILSRQLSTLWYLLSISAFTLLNLTFIIFFFNDPDWPVSSLPVFFFFSMLLIQSPGDFSEMQIRSLKTLWCLSILIGRKKKIQVRASEVGPAFFFRLVSTPFWPFFNIYSASVFCVTLVFQVFVHPDPFWRPSTSLSLWNSFWLFPQAE